MEVVDKISAESLARCGDNIKFLLWRSRMHRSQATEPITTYQKRFCHSWVVTACCFKSLFTVGLSSCHLSSNCTPGFLEFNSKEDIFRTSFFPLFTYVLKAYRWTVCFTSQGRSKSGEAGNLHQRVGVKRFLPASNKALIQIKGTKYKGKASLAIGSGTSVGASVSNVCDEPEKSGAWN